MTDVFEVRCGDCGAYNVLFQLLLEQKKFLLLHLLFCDLRSGIKVQVLTLSAVVDAAGTVKSCRGPNRSLLTRPVATTLPD